MIVLLFILLVLKLTYVVALGLVVRVSQLWNFESFIILKSRSLMHCNILLFE